MGHRKIPEINAGSMADIAFLLLIFFLVTTTMDVDTGIVRKLPPPPQPNQSDNIQMNERNVLVILVNKDNLVAIKGELIEVSELRDRVVEFFSNPSGNENLSEQMNIVDKRTEEMAKDDPDEEKIEIYNNIIAEIGDYITISKGVISIQNDRTTKYGKYMEVQNEVVGAINDLRDDLSKQTWGKLFDDLTDSQIEMIKTIYPFAISEAEPRSLATK